MISDLMKKMLAAGAPMEAVMIAVEAIEAVTLQKREDELQRKEAIRQRVKKHRENKRAVTLPKRYGNISDEFEFSAPTLSKNQDSIDEGSEVKKVSREVVARVNGTRLPEDWQPSSEDLLTAKKYLEQSRIQTETTKFVNYWTAASGKGATKRNWPRTWENWCIRAGESGPRNRTATPQPRSWKDERDERNWRDYENLKRAAFGTDDESPSDCAGDPPYGELHLVKNA
jgi:hypothetical protein